MVDLSTPVSEQEPPYRILAMDGGGIYGVFTAVMLRKLATRDPKFLANDGVTLFAGTSAGAINALLLARYDNPRDAIEDRALENFFSDERVYCNKSNPVAGALSFAGLTSWAGKEDFYSVLHDHFGQMKMKDLKQRVLITAFDLSGAADGSTALQQRWKPKVFCNFPRGERDQHLYVKDIAYAAASPPTLRPVVDGVTDGGFFANDPSVNAIAKIISKTRPEKIPLLETYEKICAAFVQTRRAEGDFINELPSAQYRKVADLLGELHRRAMQRDKPTRAGANEDYSNLTKKQAELSDGSYGTYMQDVRRAVYQVQGVLNLSLMMPLTDAAFELQQARPDAQAQTRKPSSQDRERIRAFVGSVRKLVGWELEFWEMLGNIIESADLPHAVQRQEVARPKQILALLRMADHDASKWTADEPVGDLERIVLNAWILRKLLYDEVQSPPPEELLKHISVLSLGVGAMTPHYFLKNFDFGVVPFNLLPTDLSSGFLESPLVTFALNPCKDSTSYEAQQLLGKDDYFRLDPPVIRFPVPSVMSSVFLSRFYVYRKFFLSHIYQIADSDAVKGHLNRAERWMRDHDWV